jgi:RNA polymerase sigma-70 factor (ECF subfamily)
MGLDVVDGRIASVDAVVNPDKLGHLGEVGDTVALLAAGRDDGARA